MPPRLEGLEESLSEDDAAIRPGDYTGSLAFDILGDLRTFAVRSLRPPQAPWHLAVAPGFGVFACGTMSSQLRTSFQHSLFSKIDFPKS